MCLFAWFGCSYLVFNGVETASLPEAPNSQPQGCSSPVPLSCPRLVALVTLSKSHIWTRKYKSQIHWSTTTHSAQVPHEAWQYASPKSQAKAL